MTSSRRCRRLLATSLTIAALVGSLVGVTAPAYADPDGTSVRTGALVTRLSIADGHGWLTLQPRIASNRVTGFEVVVPALGGVWGGAADVALPQLGIHCLLGPGPDLHYTCGQSKDGSWEDSGWHTLSQGTFSVTLPVTRTGSTTSFPALAGTAWVVSPDMDGMPDAYGLDTFPVLDGSHFRSTAELRDVPAVEVSGSTSRLESVLPVTMDVVPGERVTALDITLPSAEWHLAGTNAAAAGVSCFVDNRKIPPTLHCATPYRSFPVGTYQLSMTVRSEGRLAAYPTASTVTLKLGDRAEEPVDSFVWQVPYFYF